MLDRWAIRQADCLDVLRALPDHCIDSIVQDPPANIALMNQGWDDFRRANNPKDVGRDNAFGRMSRSAPEVGRTRDGDGGEAFIAYLTERFVEERRVLKPGGHALTWAMPRTADWTTTALRRAGFKVGLPDFEIRDVIVRLFGADELADAFLASLTPEQLSALAQLIESQADPAVLYHLFGQGMGTALNVSRKLEGADAEAWQGWRTRLRPAAEHWIVASAPTDLTFAENLRRWGVGALNIDGCRVGEAVNLTRTGAGRYPTHVIIDDGAAAAALDAQSGVRKSGRGAKKQRTAQGTRGVMFGTENRVTGTPNSEYGDAGGASRFFFQAKPPRSEKTAGGEIDNAHPTVKSVDLMRYLCRLVTPLDGIVLDPFAGSGTTGVACAEEGFRFLGIERGETGKGDDHQYIDTAHVRIATAYGVQMTEDDDTMITAARLQPFFRWTGSKRKQAAELAAWCAERLGAGGRYFEPCLGGGAVALAMPQGTSMVLADSNLGLGYLWWWVQQDADAVLDYAVSLGSAFGTGSNTEAGYYAVRAAYNTTKYDPDDPRPSARLLWLLQACYGGVYRENQLGGLNVPWGKRPRVPLPSPDGLRAIADHLRGADIRPGWDFADVLAEAAAGDVAFIDPPYDSDAHAFTGYVSAPFGPREQERLAESIWAAIKRGAAVCTTNADTERVRKLYDGLTIASVEEARAVGARTGGASSAPCVRITTR